MPTRVPFLRTNYVKPTVVATNELETYSRVPALCFWCHPAQAMYVVIECEVSQKQPGNPHAIDPR